MQVGTTVICQNYQGREDDQEMYRSEMKVADLTEPLGFDSFWTPEHHFDDYSIVPNPLTLLAWVAARTRTPHRVRWKSSQISPRTTGPRAIRKTS